MELTAKIKDDCFVAMDHNFEMMLAEALRYSYGRHSAATGDTARWCIPTLHHLSTPTLLIIWRDIREFLEYRKRNGINPIEIYECDVEPFEVVQAHIHAILTTERNYHYNEARNEMEENDKK